MYLTRLISPSPGIVVAISAIQPNRASIIASFQEHSSLIIALNRGRKDAYHQYKKM